MEPIIRSVPLVDGVRRIGKLVPRHQEERTPELLASPMVESKPAFIPTEVLLAQETAVQTDVEQEEQRRRELQELRERAEQEGYVAGLKKAEQEVQKSIEARQVQLAELAGKLEEAKNVVYEKAEDEIVAFIYEMCCRLAVDHVMTIEAVTGTVRKYAAMFRESEEMVMRLHPQDLEAIQKIADLDVQPGSIRWQGDLSVKLGGLMVDTPSGTLDATLDTQFSRLRDVLLAARRNKSQHR